MGTRSSQNDWEVDLKRFRKYLSEKYHVTKAYYYLGYVSDDPGPQRLYERIQEAGFILVFRQHHQSMVSIKKGNVDSDIILSIMKQVYYQENFDQMVLVSGDGDYKGLVDFLIKEDRLHKILFPNQKRASSLYKQIDIKWYANLSDPNTKKKIG